MIKRDYGEIMENTIEIIDYNEKYHADFKRMNLEYLDKYNLTETHDILVLDNPEEVILGKGGFLWLGKAGEEI